MNFALSRKNSEMEALKEHNSNIPPSDIGNNDTHLDNKKLRSKRGISQLMVDSPDQSHLPLRKDALDDEEMFFLARRCSPKESEISKIQSVQYPNPRSSRLINNRRGQSSVEVEASTDPRRSLELSRSDPVVTEPVSHHPSLADLPPSLNRVPRRLRIQPRGGFLQINRLGAGLTLLKFGWIWMSCGVLMLVDSAECSCDIIKIVFSRLRRQMLTSAGRVHEAVTKTVDLFTDNN